MTWAIQHAHFRRSHTGNTGYRAVHATVHWPRGLVLVGLTSLLLSAWGGIVPFAGPDFGYSANGSPSWHWSVLNAWLYFVPGIVGMVASLALIGRARAGLVLARAELAFLGLVLVAAGAWFVIGPAAWPVVHSGGGAAFSIAGSPLTVLTNLIGYNLGVGVLLAVLGGMAMKAGIGERTLAAVREDAMAATPPATAYPAGPAAEAGGTEPTFPT